MSGIFGRGSVLGLGADATDPTAWDNPATPADTTGGAVSQACNSPEVIKAVQSMIGIAPDGKWGAASQAKLVEAGKTFKDVAPGCTGDAPTAAATTGGGAVAPAKTGGLSFGGASADSTFNNPMTWIVLAAVAAAGIILFGKKKKA